MSLGYLVSQYPATSHTFIRREIDEMRRQGWTVDIFSIRTPAAAECESEPDRASFQETFYVLGVPLHRIVVAQIAAFCTRPVAYAKVALLALRHRAPGLRGLVWALFHFAESIVLSRELQRRGVRHLHNHFANSAATVGLLAGAFLNLPWSLTLHGISETDHPAGLLLADKIEHAQFVACASSFMRAQAMRMTSPTQWSKFLIVRCGLAARDLPRPRPRPAGRPIRIICVGRLSPEKGQLGLLEAFADVKSAGADAELILVGDGPERARIERAIDAHGLRACVSLPGRLDEGATLERIADADVLVVSSFMEGLPVVLMEAMAVGVPVIASRVAGIPELVSDGETGLLFCVGDWGDLATQLSRLLRDCDLRRRLAEAGRRRIADGFMIEDAVAPLRERFQTSLGHQPRLLKPTAAPAWSNAAR